MVILSSSVQLHVSLRGIATRRYLLRFLCHTSPAMAACQALPPYTPLAVHRLKQSDSTYRLLAIRQCCPPRSPELVTSLPPYQHAPCLMRPLSNHPIQLRHAQLALLPASCGDPGTRQHVQCAHGSLLMLQVTPLTTCMYKLSSEPAEASMTGAGAQDGTQPCWLAECTALAGCWCARRLPECCGWSVLARDRCRPRTSLCLPADRQRCAAVC